MINLKKFKKTDPSDLETEITALFEKLQKMSPASDEYDKTTDQIAKLYKLKETDSKSRVSPDVLFGSAVNLAGILLIINFEHAHALTSKALGFVGKNIRS
jgi:hypothetical protein